MKALIEPTGRIAQVSAEPFPVAKPLLWVEVPDDTTTADTWDGEKVVKYTDPPAPVPATVTRYQGIAALKAAGLYDQVIALLDDPEVPQDARDRWEHLTVFERDSQLIAQLAPKLGQSDTDLDNLFISAEQIE
ncbi:hypothetical protein [Algihabitans albus]|uniref:hypothetical protein n=1 Tax=Algihabitans albus TaxID=2164067 RepID=UPI000E5C6139|nr:hypothetical protein [Algihabitans albus]